MRADRQRAVDVERAVFEPYRQCWKNRVGNDGAAAGDGDAKIFDAASDAMMARDVSVAFSFAVIDIEPLLAA